MNGKESIPGFSGLCAICFNPIKDGDEFRVFEGGRTFHKDCAERYPNNYYMKLERLRLARRKAKEAKA